MRYALAEANGGKKISTSEDSSAPADRFRHHECCDRGGFRRGFGGHSRGHECCDRGGFQRGFGGRGRDRGRGVEGAASLSVVGDNLSYTTAAGGEGEASPSVSLRQICQPRGAFGEGEEDSNGNVVESSFSHGANLSTVGPSGGGKTHMHSGNNMKNFKVELVSKKRHNIFVF